MGRKFEEYDIYWLEEPVRPTTSRAISGSRPRWTCAWSVARRTSRVTTCGRSSSTRACRSCSPIRCARDTDLRKIATLADTWGVTIAPHLFPELNVHLSPRSRTASGGEHGLLDDLWVEMPKIANGFITAPETPGHGLAFKEEVRREFA